MATRTKEDNQLMSSLQAVLNAMDRVDDEILDALKSEKSWKASKAASAYKKALQEARMKVEQADTSLRNVARFLY